VWFSGCGHTSHLRQGRRQGCHRKFDGIVSKTPRTGTFDIRQKGDAFDTQVFYERAKKDIFEMKKLLVTFSGGETSAYMVDYLVKNKKHEYEMVFAFANTSKEREETLVFADKIDKHYNLNLIYVEGVFSMQKGVGTTYRIVDFATAKRGGEVFEDMIKSFGISNKTFPHCTRELKTNPLKKLAKDLFGSGYYTAVGIRQDEIDRVNPNWQKIKYYYPLVQDAPATKAHVNDFWRKMPFRLKLKGYQGNCDKCWKKSLRKLMTIAKEDRMKGVKDTWWSDMEDIYGNYVPEHRERNTDENYKITFFRNNMSWRDIDEMSKYPFKLADDDTINYDTQELLFNINIDSNGGGCTESCEPF
jgi:hypothetical protein